MAPIRIGFRPIHLQVSVRHTRSYPSPKLPVPSNSRIHHLLGIVQKKHGSLVKPYFGFTTHIANDPLSPWRSLVDTTGRRFDAGKDFFIEWPAGKCTVETREFAEAKGLGTIVGTQERHSADLKKVLTTIFSLHRYPLSSCLHIAFNLGQVIGKITSTTAIGLSAILGTQNRRVKVVHHPFSKRRLYDDRHRPRTP
ncbi:hypothetical protein CPB85DRAFT_1443394 [Mucidula mucida]|nr:hypothetical protein CPB85DRAFT_1443394 [Mucidula mucida]